MLRLRPFELHQPATVAEAVELGCQGRFVAGATDLLPAMKRELIDPSALISLSHLEELRRLERVGEAWVIGAGCKLQDLADHPELSRDLPALAAALGRIASPQIRRMGTIGGNVCLDTRCRYVNQSELFRQALGGCLKSHGERCHVVPGGTRCVAALSCDTAPVLVALGATLELQGQQGPRTVTLEKFYGGDGRNHLGLLPGEVLVSLRVPLPPEGTRVAYRKWSVRAQIDFPLVSVAVRLALNPNKVLREGALVVGVLGPRPRVLSLSRWQGRAVDEAVVQEIVALATTCRPLPNVPYDPDYRRHRLGVEVGRALRELLEESPCEGTGGEK